MRQFAFLAMIGVVSAIRLSQDKPATEEKSLPPISKEEMDTVFEEALKMANGDMKVLDEMTMEDWVAACQTAFPEYDNCEGKVQAAAKKHEEMEKQHGEKPQHDGPFTKEDHEAFNAWFETQEEPQSKEEMFNMVVGFCESQGTYDDCAARVQQVFDHHEQHEKDGEHEEHKPKPEGDQPQRQ